MIAIPVTAFILMAGVILIQFYHYQFLERQKLMDKKIHAAGQLDQLRTEFDDYKKKVDALVIKAGFKL